ncbi:ANM_collapsed_G0053500.mRNA.1.CDS.1 [Saccharomyces cerevisiae]|nr:ANM_collapsed_G0053500.mRNA.1.CDS.1 [Saccharomyces cerevisiae]
MILEQNENWEFEKWFAEAHKREFGFAFSEKCVIVDDVRVRATAKSCVRDEEPVDEQLKRYKPRSVFAAKEASFFKNVYFDNGWLKTPVFKIDDMTYGSVVKGPAILADGTQTNIIPENSEAIVLKSHIFVKILRKSEENVSDEQKSSRRPSDAINI